MLKFNFNSKKTPSDNTGREADFQERRERTSRERPAQDPEQEKQIKLMKVLQAKRLKIDK